MSLCQKYLAIATDKIGNEEYDLIIRDIKTKQILSKDIKTSGNIVWAKNDYLFYTVLNKERRPYKVMRHSLENDPKKDSGFSAPAYQKILPSVEFVKF